MNSLIHILPHVKINTTVWQIFFYITILHSTILQSSAIAKLQAQETSITFIVDLTHNQLSENESIVLRGSSATLGRWLGSDLRLSQIDDNIYSITVFFPAHELNQELFYKYVVVNPEQYEQWETRPNRTLQLTNGQHILDPVFFNDVNQPILSQDLPVRFTLNLENLGHEPPSRVGIAGNRMPLERIAPNSLILLEKEADLWKTDIVFDAGTPADLNFTFYFEVDGKWQKEANQHALLLNNSRPSRTIAMRHNGIRIIPDSNSKDLLVDAFAQISHSLGEAGSQYMLDVAFQQLAAGSFNNAMHSYQRFKSEFLDSQSEEERILLQDQFPIQYGQQLYAAGKVDQAISFFDFMEQETTEPARSAAFAYALAAAQLSASNYTDALQGFDEIAETYLNADGSTRSLIPERGIVHLEAGQYTAGTQIMNTLGSKEYMYNNTKKILANAHSDSAHYDAAIATLETIKYAGSDTERLKTHIQIIETNINAGYYRDALEQIKSLLSPPSPADTSNNLLHPSAINPHRLAHLLFLKARIFEVQRQALAADKLYQQILSQYPGTKHARLAQTRTEKLN